MGQSWRRVRISPRTFPSSCSSGPSTCTSGPPTASPRVSSARSCGTRTSTLFGKRHTTWRRQWTCIGATWKLQEFNSRQAGGALVGEWSLAGTEYDETYTPEEKADRLRELALWVASGFMERSKGCLYWNLDANYTEWSYERSTSAYNIDWAGMAKPAR